MHAHEMHLFQLKRIIVINFDTHAFHTSKPRKTVKSCKKLILFLQVGQFQSKFSVFKKMIHLKMYQFEVVQDLHSYNHYNFYTRRCV
jgi:hypothetical protein